MTSQELYASQQAKRKTWLQANPEIAKYLRTKVGLNLYDWCREPQALAMAGMLKAEGYYSSKTCNSDICVAMRNMAAREEVAA